MNVEYVETDVLCVGGGITGLMAAIRASERGARVTVAEKGNAIASGSARAGNDHFNCYIPEVHGADIKPFVQRLQSHRGQIRELCKRLSGARRNPTQDPLIHVRML